MKKIKVFDFYKPLFYTVFHRKDEFKWSEAEKRFTHAVVKINSLFKDPYKKYYQ